MNVKLHISIDFIAGIWYQGVLQFNNYNLNLQLLTASTDQSTVATAVDRAKYFITQELNHTVFIHSENESVAMLLTEIGADVTTLPEDPVDQVIGIMLYCKLNTIMEQQVILTSLDISSVLGDSVWYNHTEDDVLGPFAEPGWWFDNDLCHNDLKDDQPNDNVVKVDTAGWRDYGLEWPREPNQHTATIVYPDFRKNENK